MDFRDLGAEAVAIARAQWVPSLTIMLLVMAMCVTTLLTVGRTAHAEAQVQDRLDAAGSRYLSVADTSDHDILTPAVVDVVIGLSSVEVAVGASLPQDAVLAAVPGTSPVPLRWVSGQLTDAVTLTSGRWPEPDEVIVAQATAAQYGLDGPVGAVLDQSGAELPIVGTYTASEPWEQFTNGAIARNDGTAPVRSVMVLATSSAQAGSAQQSLLQVVASPDPQWLQVNSPATLAEVQQQIGGDLSQFSRALLTLVIASGAVLTAIVVLADSLVRQRDLGRRRALGASRSDLITLVVGRTTLTALAGAVAGTTGGWGATHVVGHPPPVDFAFAVGVLAVLTASVAAVPPATLAAYRDPVVVLRTP